MISERLQTIITSLKGGGQAAPLLVSEKMAEEIIAFALGESRKTLAAYATMGIADLFLYDCSDRDKKQHLVDKVRSFVQRLYQRPNKDIMIAVFLNLDVLGLHSHNALLKLFEDVPTQLLILVTSPSPEQIIPTLQSRIIRLDHDTHQRGENPLQGAIDDFVNGKPETLFSHTLGKEFKKEQALWVVTGLQYALLNGKIHPRNARNIQETRIALETTNTIAKYLTDRLLISLLCDL